MNLNEAFDINALIGTYNPYERNRSERELVAHVQMMMPIFEAIPAAYAQKYVTERARAGEPVRHVTEVAKAWEDEKNRRLERAESELIAPPEIADNTAAWLEWMRHARATISAGHSTATAAQEANRQVGYTPRREITGAVSGEESAQRLSAMAREIMRARRVSARAERTGENEGGQA